MRLSAFVITCDRPRVLRACLKRLQFVDELIVVDKGRIGLSPDEPVTDRLDKYERVAWSPVVEDTRAHAQSLCTGDYILCLDDDEIISRNSAEAIPQAIAHAHDIAVWQIPIHHWILGRFDERAYAPEWRPALYRRGAVSYEPIVHAGTRINCDRREMGGLDNIWIDHLSHPDIATYLEKTNRYTAQQQRCGIQWSNGLHLREYALWRVAQIDSYPDQGVQAVQLMRALYEVVDLAKRWEETQPSGRATFDAFCEAVEQED